jgi:hypothetical protein
MLESTNVSAINISRSELIYINFTFVYRYASTLASSIRVAMSDFSIKNYWIIQNARFEMYRSRDSRVLMN